MKNIIAIYPGRFQPFGKHHAAAFLWLQKQFGKNNTYVVTSDKVELPKSPLDYKTKEAIINTYGIDNVVKVKNPYKAEELMSKFNPEDTAVVFMVGEKDMKEDPRFKIGLKKSGEPGYFQKYTKGAELEGFDKHGYLITAPHMSLNVPGYGEMSGTSIRKALGDKTKSRTEKEQLFTDIFGWYSPKLANIIFDAFEGLNETDYHGNLSKVQEPYMPQVDLANNMFSVDWWMSNIFSESVITEGGAAKHMAHPFDLPNVKTGKDLINVFTKSVKYLETQPASVKIDGVNASIRLITLNNAKTFVMDRGSNKPLDVKGVTKAELEDRFGAGHGMIKVGGKVLDIFNEAVPTTTSELKQLGLWNNPNILLNIEYVEGTSNVLEYGRNFLAIHGLLEITQTTPTKRDTKEIPYNSTVLQKYIDKLQLVAQKHGFVVVGSVPTRLDSAPNLDAVLNTKYTTLINGVETTSTLRNLLATATNPKDINIKLSDGSRVSALNKKTLLRALEGEDLKDIVADPKDIEAAKNGIVFYLATMELGNAVLEALSSDLGAVKDQEGIVIRDRNIASVPFKITGRFIVKGLESQFRK